jgi:hypothetical protein
MSPEQISVQYQIGNQWEQKSNYSIWRQLVEQEGSRAVFSPGEQCNPRIFNVQPAFIDWGI